MEESIVWIEFYRRKARGQQHGEKAGLGPARVGDYGGDGLFGDWDL